MRAADAKRARESHRQLPGAESESLWARLGPKLLAQLADVAGPEAVIHVEDAVCRRSWQALDGHKRAPGDDRF
jgi:hypothetical protein